MNNYLSKIVLFMLFICIPIYSGYANNDSYIIKNSLENALLLSKETQQPILVIFSAPWCKNWKVMEKDLIANISDLDLYILCIVNIEEREDLKKMYKVKNIPDYILIKDNIEIKRNVGYHEYINFYRWLTE